MKNKLYSVKVYAALCMSFSFFCKGPYANAVPSSQSKERWEDEIFVAKIKKKVQSKITPEKWDTFLEDAANSPVLSPGLKSAVDLLSFENGPEKVAAFLNNPDTSDDEKREIKRLLPVDGKKYLKKILTKNKDIPEDVKKELEEAAYKDAGITEKMVRKTDQWWNQIKKFGSSPFKKHNVNPVADKKKEKKPTPVFETPDIDKALEEKIAQRRQKRETKLSPEAFFKKLTEKLDRYKDAEEKKAYIIRFLSAANVPLDVREKITELLNEKGASIFTKDNVWDLCQLLFYASSPISAAAGLYFGQGSWGKLAFNTLYSGRGLINVGASLWSKKRNKDEKCSELNNLRKMILEQFKPYWEEKKTLLDEMNSYPLLSLELKQSEKKINRMCKDTDASAACQSKLVELSESSQRVHEDLEIWEKKWNRLSQTYNSAMQVLNQQSDNINRLQNLCTVR